MSEDSYKSNPVKQQLAPQVPMVPTSQYPLKYDTPHEGPYQKTISGLGGLFGFCGAIPCLFCCQNPYVSVGQGEVGLITRFGALKSTVVSGSTYVNTWAEKLSIVSIRNQIREIPQQDCLTKDNVPVSLSSVISYRITDPQLAVLGIDNVHESLIIRTQTTLRDVTGSKTLQEVIEKRDSISQAVSEIIANIVETWGVHISSILIKDIHLPPSVSGSMSKAAEAKRIGESKIITAKAEVESAKLMRQAADILASEAAMQIRYLDAMQSMAKSSGSKVIFMPYSSNPADNVGKENKYGKGNLAITEGELDGFTNSDIKTAMNTYSLQEANK